MAHASDPRTPDPRIHASHDRELIAAYAAGDATGSDLETATALVAGCAECSALHHDLRLIAAALPVLPAPVRRRDFRLTPDQAAALRPSGWRRVMGAFAAPRFRFAAPLGTGLATLGLAGILLGTLAGAPLGFGGGTSAQPATAPERDAGGALAAKPTAEPADLAGPTSPANLGPLPLATSGPAASAVAGQATHAGAVHGAAAPPVATQSAASNTTGWTLRLAGAAAVLAGIALVTLRWASRRPA
jgi:hypothetical protein